MALAVTRTVAPVSARIAGQRPVRPATVVTRKTDLEPERDRDVLADVAHGASGQVDHAGEVEDPAVQDGGVGGL